MSIVSEMCATIMASLRESNCLENVQRLKDGQPTE